MAEEIVKEKSTVKSKFYFFVMLGLLLFIGGAIMSGFVIKQQPQILGLSTQSEITTLISQVGKLIVLPTNELPTVTNISDASKVNDQPFFKNAKTGDKLLVYPSIKWAVLYRPSENRIIEVGAFDVNPQTAMPVVSTTPSPTPSPSPTPTESPSPTPTVTVIESPTSSPAGR